MESVSEWAGSLNIVLLLDELDHLGATYLCGEARVSISRADYEDQHRPSWVTVAVPSGERANIGDAGAPDATGDESGKAGS
jgi:hypothetical protein